MKSWTMKTKTTETLDKLYLEWSQFTEARNSREITAVNLIGSARTRLELSDCTKEDIAWVIETLNKAYDVVKSDWMDRMQP